MRRKKQILRRGIACLLAALIVFTGLPSVQAFADTTEETFDPVTESQIEDGTLPEDPSEPETGSPEETETGESDLTSLSDEEDSTEPDDSTSDETSGEVIDSSENEDIIETTEEVEPEVTESSDKEEDPLTDSETVLDISSEENTDKQLYDLSDEHGNPVPDGDLDVYYRSYATWTYVQAEFQIPVADSKADLSDIEWPESIQNHYMLRGENCFVYIQLDEDGEIMLMQPDGTYQKSDGRLQLTDDTEKDAEAEEDAEINEEETEVVDVEEETETSDNEEDLTPDNEKSQVSNSEAEDEEEAPQEEAKLFNEIAEDSIFSESQLNSMNFSSKRLLIAGAAILDPENMLSGYDGVYLMQYEDETTARNAYSYYYGKAAFVEIDTVISIAEGEGDEAGIPGEMTDLENPLAELQEAMAENGAAYADPVIALIDTGVSGFEDHLVEAVSMIGDDLTDRNGHGTSMAGYIIGENPYAKILSIKALDDNGNGDVSAVYAAIRYAIDKGVSIINLSLSAAKKLDSASIVSIINEAADAGITVVGAAGNNGANAVFFIPGSVESARIIGAADENGERLPSSNYGATVDYNVVAEATSIAAAKYSGHISRYGIGDPDYKLIFPTDYVKPEEEPEVTVPEVVIEDTALYQYFTDHVRRDLSGVNKEDLVDAITHKLTFVNERIWKDTNGDGVTDLFDIYYNKSDDYLTESYTKNTYAGFYNLDDASPYLVAYLPMESDREYVFRSFDLTVENNDGQVIKDEYYVFDPEANLLYVNKAWFEIPWENGIIGSLRSQSVYTFSEGTITDLTKKVHIKAEFSVDDGYEAPEDAELIDTDYEVTILDTSYIRFNVYKSHGVLPELSSIFVYVNGSIEPLPEEYFGFNEDGEFLLIYDTASLSDVRIILGIGEKTVFRIAASVEEAIATLESYDIWLLPTVEVNSSSSLPAVGDRITFEHNSFDGSAMQPAVNAGGVSFIANAQDGQIVYTTGMDSVLNELLNSSGSYGYLQNILNNTAVTLAANAEGQAALYSYKVSGNVYKQHDGESSNAAGTQIAKIDETTLNLVCTHITVAAAQNAFGPTHTDMSSVNVFGKVFKVDGWDANNYATVYVGLGSTRTLGSGVSANYVQAQYNITRIRLHYTPPTGYAYLTKSSSNTNVTANNPNYKLTGAEYTVYENQACTTIAKDASGANAVLTVQDETGKTNTIEINAGTYWVKEIRAGTGYKIDPDPHQVTVTSGNTTAVPVTDAPETGYLRAKKESSDKKLTDGNACYDLSGIKFYVYTDRNCTMRAKNAAGSTDFYLISGTDGCTGTAEMPIGTYWVQEDAESAKNKGWALVTSAAKEEISVSAANTSGSPATATIKNTPNSDPIGILLTKRTAGSGTEGRRVDL
ncbi:MAG: hypothetical protein IKS18_07595 [Lachnospiraceae bacterium]|nr:hypothetical protein [Lachnospiraceae bacterium]